MIIREIKDRRDEVLSRFDWFNDYKDTRIYAVNNCDEETVRLLDEGNQKWMRERMKKFQSIDQGQPPAAEQPNTVER